ncbi:Replication factor A protein 3 [Zalerion maritima]|uniref:Replication factor A protein 3 n=1 Tax=Zalerion maritima TaxID=339359 RepID=A0AAD5RQ32_9PEZI|nr:Replication factor A protein 3 [Zalerion maritima]
MESTSTPRVTYPYLNNYVGQTVILVGKVVQLRGDAADIDADGTVTATLNRDTHITPGNGVQIIGKVNPDLSIRTLTTLDLGGNVDFGLASIVAEISQQYKEIHSF